MTTARKPARSAATRSTSRARSGSVSGTRRIASSKPDGANGNKQQGDKAIPPLHSEARKLEAERAQVLGDLARLRAELLEAPALTGDEVDLNVYEREKTLGLVKAYERRLEEIEAALRAAERGQYGICERCAEPIDPARLTIFPETRLCVKCKNEAERQARRALLR